jgi:hypothetical protein
MITLEQRCRDYANQAGQTCKDAAWTQYQAKVKQANDDHEKVLKGAIAARSECENFEEIDPNKLPPGFTPADFLRCQDCCGCPAKRCAASMQGRDPLQIAACNKCDTDFSNTVLGSERIRDDYIRKAYEELTRQIGPPYPTGCDDVAKKAYDACMQNQGPPPAPVIRPGGGVVVPPVPQRNPNRMYPRPSDFEDPLDWRTHKFWGPIPM